MIERPINSSPSLPEDESFTAQGDAQGAAHGTKLLAIAAALAGALRTDEVAAIVLREGGTALGAKVGLIVQRTADGEALELVASEGYPADALGHYQHLLHTYQGPLAAALPVGEPIFIETPEDAAERSPDLAALLPRPSLHPWAILPLLLAGQPVGVLALGFPTPHRFSPTERTLLQTLAHQCSLALDRARLYAAAHEARLAAERAVERTSRLHTISAALAAAMVPSDVAEVVITQCLALLGARAGGLVLLNERGDLLETVRTQGYDPEVAADYGSFPLTPPSPLADAIVSGEMVIVASRKEWWRYPHIAAAHGDLLSPAVVALPLQIKGTMVGALGLSFGEERVFSTNEVAFMRTLAQQCAQALERAQLYEAERLARLAAEKAQWRQALLNGALHAFANESLDLGRLLRRVARQVAQAIGDCCVVRLLANDGTTLAPGVAYHSDEARQYELEVALAHTPVPNGSGIVGSVAATGQPLLLPMLTTEQRAALLHRPIDEGESASMLHSALVAPLRVQNRLLGSVLLVRDITPAPYTHENLLLLSDLADRAALAIANAQLYSTAQQAQRATERAATRIARLQRVTAALGAALTPAEVGQVIVSEGLAAVHADAGSIFMLTDGGATFEALSYRGYPQEMAPGYSRIPADSPGPLHDAVTSRTVVAVETPEELVARWPHLATAQARVGDAATAVVPLLLDQTVLGVLYIAFRTPRHFSAEDRALLLALAQQCAQALDRARLYEVERQARAEAEAAVRLRDSFFSTASHELKTPLTSLLGQAELFVRRLRRASHPDPALIERAETVVAQAVRLDKLINALLDFSRIEQGRLSIEHLPLDLAALIRQVVDELQPTLTRHTLLYEGGHTPLMIIGDGLRLEQVLQNLVSNAVKYSPQGGNVSVRAERHGATVAVSVIDTGIGIPSEALQNLFAQFYRAPNALSSHISGLGIGLYVVKEIVTLHGGTLAVNSVEGQGSTFTITLPLAERGLGGSDR